jgi:hypothetical protein
MRAPITMPWRISHPIWTKRDGSWISFARWAATANVSTAGTHSHSITGGDSATTPINAALNWIIKAKIS